MDMKLVLTQKEAVRLQTIMENAEQGSSEQLAELVKENGYHIACGLIGTKYIFDSLSDNGYSDVIYKMIKVPDMPSFACFINNGLTTLPETWDMTCSLNHHMFSEVDNWMYKYVGGIHMTEDGILVKPYKMLK